MTLANKITFGRLALIPVFVACVVIYGNSAGESGPDLRWRWAAIAIFLLAAISDGVDGYIARRYNQKTLLGTTVDPIADKVLMLSAVFALGATTWTPPMPPWYVVLTFARETIILLGIAFMYGFLRRVRMGPQWTSKVSTVLQMACVALILIDFRKSSPELPWLLGISAAFMVVSTIFYIIEGLRQFAAARNLSPSTDATEP